MDSQELKDLSLSLWKKLRKAIQDGDSARAVSLLDKVEDNTRRMREVVLDFADIAFTELAERAGEEAIYDALKKAHHRIIKPVFGDDYPQLGIEERIRRRAAGWTELHNVNIEIEEEDERFVMRIPCDTGGVLNAKAVSGKTKQGYPWSWGEPGASYYCTHCAISFEVLGNQEAGHPWWVSFRRRSMDGRCVQYHYKDMKGVPEEYRRRTQAKTS